MTTYIASRPIDGSLKNDWPRRLTLTQRYRWLLLMGLLMTLPGCSGCQKKAPEPPPKVEEPAPPPVEPVETTPPEEKPDENPEGKPARPSADNTDATETTAKNDEKAANPGGSPSGSPAGDSKAGAKSDGVENSGPKVGVSPRPAPKSKANAAANPDASSKTGRPPPTAAVALESAKRLQKKAADAADGGNYGKAFDLSSQAWEAAHTFPDNSECQALCKELETQLELWGDRANALVSPQDARNKKLVDQ